MSRALGPEVKAALGYGDPNQAYRDIVSALHSHNHGPDDNDDNDNDNDGLLEIEILPTSFPLEPGRYLVRDGRAVGVHKLHLVQAFFVARRILMGCGPSYTPASASASAPAPAPPSPDEIAAAAAVVLVMDPEHLTAANQRKRILVAALHREPSHDSQQQRQRQRQLIRREAIFVDSLLTSPLHRHAKSPTLWSHRRWLVAERLRHGGGGPLGPEDARRDICDVVMVAGERHPRNYSAWWHARWLVQQVELLPPLLVAHVRDWCVRHHSDISGWSFLAFILARTGSPELSESTRDHIAELASRMVWNNESVLWFLRATARRPPLPPLPP